MSPRAAGGSPRICRSERPAGASPRLGTAAQPTARPLEGPPSDGDLAVTATFDHDSPAVREWALHVTAGSRSAPGRAQLLFAAVRDLIRYDPYCASLTPDAFVASAVLRSERNWCVPKAVLLASGARAVGIPARIGFADVRNHLTSPKLRRTLGSDLFVFHGYASLYLEGAWRKASPAFNAELCERFGVPPLQFDGRSDALLHAYDGAGRRHMEYVNDRGTWTGVPFAEILAAFKQTYARSELATARMAADPAFHF